MGIEFRTADQLLSSLTHRPRRGKLHPHQTFSYDELGRLTGITANGSSWSIGYDANGNRTGVTLNGASSSYSISATSNRITSISNPTRSFGYDAAGNTTADGNYTATYDTSGRLATLTKAGVTSTFSIDSLGRRVRKFDSSGPASTVVFVFGLYGELLGEYDSTGKAIREYVWLNNTPIAVFTPDPASATNPPLVYFIHADHIDTPRIVVDKNNNLRWRWLAEPFGTTAPENNPAGLGVFTFNLRFPGQYFDQGTGLNQNWFRDYDASIGSYAQVDPLGLGGGINPRVYVNGNPVSNSDPDGLFARTGVTQYVVPNANSIRVGNPGSPGGYGSGDPRAAYPCAGVWSDGRCIPVMTNDPQPVDPKISVGHTSNENACKLRFPMWSLTTYVNCSHLQRPRPALERKR